LTRGRFIVLEGVDGCGSTTHAERLAERLRARQQDVLLTCEPSSGPVGRLLREALEHRLVDPVSGAPQRFSWATYGLLFAADRVDHAQSVIVPALEKGTTIVCDRYDLSSLTYQSATAPPGEPVLDWLRQLNARVPRPDLTIVLDVSAETAELRRSQRAGTAQVFEVSELQRRLVDLYRRAEELVPGDRIVHVSAEGDRDAVADAVAAACRGL